MAKDQKEEKSQMIATQESKKLKKSEILTNGTRHTLFNCLMQGMMIKDAAKQAKRDYKYCRNLVAYSGINALVKQEMAEIERKTTEKLAITREGQIKKYQSVIDGAETDKAWSAVNGAIRGQSELVGLHDTAQETFEKMSLAAALSQASRRKAIDSTVQQKVIEGTVEPDIADPGDIDPQNQAKNKGETVQKDKEK
jgi:hypothetical protein